MCSFYLPGVGEINRLLGLLRDVESQGVDLLPLHGSLPLEQQATVLQMGDRRRVILSTNIAETSITVPGVRVVIDSTQQRHAQFDVDFRYDPVGLNASIASKFDSAYGPCGARG